MKGDTLGGAAAGSTRVSRKAATATAPASTADGDSDMDGFVNRVSNDGHMDRAH